MSSLVLDNIGLLVTNDPALGEGPLGTRRNAALVIEDGRVTEVAAAGAVADRPDRRGRPLRHPGLRRQPHAPRVRRRPSRGVRGSNGGRAVRCRRHPGDRREHPRGER